MNSFFKKLRSQRGFTMVEVLVVVAIVGILAAVSFNLITSIFVTSLRSSQIATQEGNMERTFGFLGSRLAVTQPGASQIGLTNQQGDSVLRANELFFKSSYEGGLLYCYRMHYDGSTRKLSLAQTTNLAACAELQSSDLSFANIRDKNMTNPNDVNVYTFAEGVIPTKNNDGSEIADTACQENNVTGDQIFSYSASSGNAVTEVTASMAFCPTPEPDSIVKVIPRKFTQTFSIGQLCLVGSGGGGSGVADNSVGPAQINELPVEATDFGPTTISSTPISTDGDVQWYKVTLPNNWGNSLWKLVPGYYNISASAKFSWSAATGPGSREAAALAIVKNGSRIAYSSGPEFDKRAYVSVSTGVQLTVNDDVSLWVATTDVTPDRFEGGRISGTWQN